MQDPRDFFHVLSVFAGKRQGHVIVAIAVGHSVPRILNVNAPRVVTPVQSSGGSPLGAILTSLGSNRANGSTRSL